MRRRSVILAGVHAYPDPAIGARRLSEFARHLASKGFEVHVIAEFQQHARSGGELPEEVVRHGIEKPQPISTTILRLLRRQNDAVARPQDRAEVAIEVPRRPASQVLQRLQYHYHRYTVSIDNYKRWALRCGWQLLRLTGQHRPDAVFVSGPPFSLFAIAAIVCRWRGIALISDFRDPWLKAAEDQTDEYRGFRQRVDAALEKFTISRSWRITTTSQRLTTRLAKQHPRHATRIYTVRNGFEADMELPPPVPNGRLELLYAGTIYLNRNPMPLFEAVARLAARGVVAPGKLRLRLVGECRRWRDVDLPQWVLEKGMSEYISIEPPVPAARVRELASTAHVLVNFAQAQKDAVPAKLFEQIASSRQILLFAEDDSESAMAGMGCALVTRLDSEVVEIEAAIEKLYQEWTGPAGVVRVKPDVTAFRRDETNRRLEAMLPPDQSGSDSGAARRSSPDSSSR